jgi:hypothetical protein
LLLLLLCEDKKMVRIATNHFCLCESVSCARLAEGEVFKSENPMETIAKLALMP